MGRLIEGKWKTEDVITSDEKGAFKRAASVFRDHITAGGAFPPESGRYHLFVSYACPWAHRTLIYRKLKSLENHIDVSVVHPDMLEKGWGFDSSYPGATGDKLYGSKYLKDIYIKADKDISTKVTVPVLWDKKTERIVNNESSEIIRIFNSEFDELTNNREDFYPESIRSEIDKWNKRIYEGINNGVYRCGFAKTQEAYDEAADTLFKTLNDVEQNLEGKRFMHGELPLETDFRLFPTLIRFDEVYYVHFKCNLQRIADYPNLSQYTKRVFELKGVRETVNLDHIKRHYFYSHESINPHRIVPLGPKRWVD